MNGDDMALLKEYAEDHSEPAFAALVSRHVNLVYSVALRHVGNPHMAEEITQNVFIILAQKAKSLDPKTILSGWLCRTARYVSANALQVQCRRQRHEQEAQMGSTLEESESDLWNQISPLLDDALDCLGEKEYHAIVLRFFEGKEFKQVGAAMATTEDAARMRVNRGLEKLRTFFHKRGVALPGGALATALAANCVQTAPAGLAAVITTAACQAATTATATVAVASKAITMTTLQKTIVGGLLAITLGTGIYEARIISQLRERNRRLEQQPAPLPASISIPGHSETRRGTTLADQRDDGEVQRVQKEHLELLSLRGKVRQLSEEIRQLKVTGQQDDSASSRMSEPSDGDSILFTASVTNRVSPGQTLVVGGWSMDGMRGYLLLTPIIRTRDGASDAPPLAIQSQVIGAPETFWSQIGWREAKSSTRGSAIAGVLTSAQLNLLLTALQGTEGSELSNTSLAKRDNDEPVGIGFSISDGNAEGTLMRVDVYPRLDRDGESVELAVRPSANATNSPIFPSLRPVK
jgi:RNA polymerase sigma factor (sigma-70 family)